MRYSVGSVSVCLFQGICAVDSHWFKWQKQWLCTEWDSWEKERLNEGCKKVKGWEVLERWIEGVVTREGGIGSEGKGDRRRRRSLCVNGCCRSLLQVALRWPTRFPPVWRKYHQGNFVSLPLCMFSSLPGLFLNSIRLPAQTKDYKPQHPWFVVFRICQFTNQEKLQQMFSSSPFPQLHCRLFAKMGDDRPFVCNAPGCGQVSFLPSYPRCQRCTYIWAVGFFPLFKFSLVVCCMYDWM